MNGGVFMFLFLLLIVSPCRFFTFCAWSSKPTTPDGFIHELETKAIGEQIDQIDYRGPETHSFIPPPRSKFGPHKYTTTTSSKLPMPNGRSNCVVPGATGTRLLGSKVAACRDQGSVIIRIP